MKFSLITLVCWLLFTVSGYTQSFEGEIVYSNTFKSKINNLSDEQLSMIVGTVQEYYIKGGNYQSRMNGQAITMQLYDDVTNRIYNKTPKSDTLYWFDASINMDTLKSHVFRKNAGTILGYACDALVLNTTTGTTTLYYSKQLRLDGDKYKRHHYDNWDFYAGQTGSLPLKIIVENGQFRMESTATKIAPMKLEQKYFTIDSQTPVKKSSSAAG